MEIAQYNVDRMMEVDTILYLQLLQYLTMEIGRYDAVLAALAISYDGNRSIRRSPYDGNYSSCNIVRWKSVDTTFTDARSFEYRTTENVRSRYCSCSVY